MANRIFTIKSSLLLAMVWALVQLLCGSGDGIQIAAARTRTIKSASPSRAIAFSPDGKTVVNATFVVERKGNKKPNKGYSEIILFDARTGKRKLMLTCPSAVVEVAISPDGKTLATSAITCGAVFASEFSSRRNFMNGELRVWNIATKHSQRFIKVPNVVAGLAFSPEGKYLAVGGDVGDQEREQAVFVYDTSTWKLRRRCMDFEDGHMMDVAFSHSENLLAGVTVAGEVNQGELNVWDVRTGKTVLRRVDGDMEDNLNAPLQFEADDKSLLCKNVRIHLSGRKKQRQQLFHAGQDAPVAFNLHRQLAAIVSDRSTVEIWSLKSKRRLRIIQGYGASFLPIVFSPRGDRLAVAGENRNVRLFDL